MPWAYSGVAVAVAWQWQWQWRGSGVAVAWQWQWRGSGVAVASVFFRVLPNFERGVWGGKCLGICSVPVHYDGTAIMYL